MSMISEQIHNLRSLATETRCLYDDDLHDALIYAADTIEYLSAKLQAENMERSEKEVKVWRYCKECEHYTPLPNGVRGGKRGHCEKRYPRDSRRGCTRACKMFSEKKNENEP